MQHYMCCFMKLKCDPFTLFLYMAPIKQNGAIQIQWDFQICFVGNEGIISPQRMIRA